MALSKREKAQKAMTMLVRSTGKVHYAQRRPMSTRSINTFAELTNALKRSQGITCDCSEAVTLIMHIAGFADPNGFGYNGWGFTGTLLNKCKPHFTDPAKANIATILICGPGSGDHAMIVYKPGRDPILFSHGSERDPKFVRYSQIVPYLRKPATFCSIGKLG